MDINTRKKWIENLDLFIREHQRICSNALESLGWTEESLQKEQFVHCSKNLEHWIPESALSHHEEICEGIQDGYLEEELNDQPPDSSFFYQKSSSVIPVLINRTVQEKILSEHGLLSKDTCLEFPKTVDRWSVYLNPEQRLAVYDYIVSKTKVDNKSKNVTLEDLMVDFEKKEEEEDKPKSQLEILAEMRDYKRRRQSYRAKNVHITKKSYTEIMKEVIENQTNYLAETRKFENSENVKERNEDSDFSHKIKLNEDNQAVSEIRESHSEHKRSKDIRKYSPKRKKRRKSRSRSRSASRHKHRKSHHKPKRSHD